jgi:hypothetical protein
MENLPYLLSIIPLSIADPVPPGGGAPGTLKYWFQPQLWNPHQLPSGTLPGYPSKFRAYAYGRTMGVWRKSTAGTLSAYQFGPPTQYDDGFGNVGSPGRLGEVYFNNPGDKTSPFYNNPRPLTLDLATTSGSLIVDTANTPSTNYYDGTKWSSLPGDAAPPNQFAGFADVGDPNFNPNPSTDQVERFIVPDLPRKVHFSLHYLGPDGNYHPYSFMARIPQCPIVSAKYLRTFDLTAFTPGRTHSIGWGPSRPDPRTDRFSEFTVWWGQGNPKGNTMNPNTGSTFKPQGSGAGGNGSFGVPYLPGAFTYIPLYSPNLTGTPSANGTGLQITLWARNDRSYATAAGVQCYYADPDGIVRYGDAYRQNAASGDGNPFYHGNAAVSPSSTITNPLTGSALRRRPVILNRPFRSVGELGFAYRDLPFKTLDLWSPASPDAALLDLFSLADAPVLSAGQINPSRASEGILKALFADAYKSEELNAKILDAEAQALASVVSADANAAPYANRADLASAMGNVVSGSSGTQAFNTTAAASASWANKSFAEAPMRALSNSSGMRTWNLLVDVVAQTGALTPNATNLGSHFFVQGERRYWLYVAIDRCTGKIVDQQLEPYYD